MTTVVYKNGFVSDYDETIKVGDVIRAYNSGFHRVTKIESRPHSTPLISYTKICKEDGSKSSALKSSCDASYCRHAIGYVNSLIEDHEKAIKSLRDFIVQHGL